MSLTGRVNLRLAQGLVPGLEARGPIRVNAAIEGTSASPRITIEQQVTRDLVITYITSTQQQIIQVEYNVNRNVSIVALRDHNGTFGLDVKFKKRFR